MPEIDPDSVHIRAAEPEDVNLLDEFIKPFVEQKKLIPRTFGEMQELVRHGFLAESGGAPIGFAALEIYSSKLGEIRSLAVLEEWRGCGVGKKLVAACVERACERGVLEIMAITSSENFFKSCGFDFTLPGEKKALFIQTREL